VVAFKAIERVGDAVGLQELGEVVGAFDGTAVLGAAEGQGDEGEAVGNLVEARETVMKSMIRATTLEMARSIF
jgi:hypothetical protein